MMLSPQAARIGMVIHKISRLSTVSSRYRHKLAVTYFNSSTSPVKASLHAPSPSSSFRANPKASSSSLLSTTAAQTSYEEDVGDCMNYPNETLRRWNQVNESRDTSFTSVAATSNRHHRNIPSQRSTSHVLSDEPWRVNLHREDDSWLNGPRSVAWFTGVEPLQCPGVDEGTGELRSIPLPNLSSVTRENAKQYFDNSWSLYETLFAGLKGEEGFYRPPVHGLRHPQIFYYGHTACLYINKLRVAGVLEKPVNPYFESIFEVGVDEMLWDDMHKNDMLWPTVSEVHAYRKQVYETVANAIRTHSSLDDSHGVVQVDSSHPMWALFMGFEHERIHLETSSVLFRETPLHLVQSPMHWPRLHPSAYRRTPTSHPVEGVDFPNNRMIPVSQPEMTVDLGKPADFPSYGWDNEYGERQVDVPPFSASEHMVSNGEYWHFVASGGYVDRKYWCDDGWAWRTHRNLKRPYFWEQEGPGGSHEYSLRTIFEVIDMPWDWPVDVNYYEAKAYCRWKTARDCESTQSTLPYRILTEAEHHIIRHREHNLIAARDHYSNDKVMVTSGCEFPHGPTGANINLAFSSQNPVDYFLPSQTGHRDTTGNAWEWTEDHFNPLFGFEHHAYYDDFSIPCFDGKHSMIVGGSFISTGDEASVFARFHFRPHFLQHSGFRLVTSANKAPAKHLYARFEGQASARDAALAATHVPATKKDSDGDSDDSVYETEESLHMYLGLHYPTSGEAENVSPILSHPGAPIHALRFPQRVVELLKSLNPVTTNHRALDIGCAVGGSSFELAKTFSNVDAFDFSNSFVTTAQKMQAKETIHFRIPVEADLYENARAVHEPGMTPEILSRVHFFVGDACQVLEMKAKGVLSTYDGIVMSNLLCRLPDPMACLNGLSCIVNKGGVVVLVTPFSWLPEFTPRSKWLGGFLDPVSKAPIYSKDVLRIVMEQNGFVRIHEEQMPLVIREHQRKYQYIISEATGWRKVK